MPRRIPPKVARNVNAKVHNVSRWAFWVALFILALIAYAVWITLYVLSNQQAILVGKSVDCVDRPSYDYFAFCNGLRDGAACTHESRSRMMTFYEPIDYACAKSEPPKQFRFPTHREPETLEVAEVES